MKITVETIVAAPIESVWRAYTTAEGMTQWNAASDDWHCPRASVDLRVGGSFTSRMEARDGSAGFDFGGTYTVVEAQKLLAYSFDDRTARIEFVPSTGGVLVRVTFDAENVFPIEQQRAGWQSILNNFKAHAERANLL